MFVFTTITTVAIWFVVRLGYDLAWPAHRTDPGCARRRHVAITGVAAFIAGAGLGGIVWAVYGRTPGLITGGLVATGYVLFVGLLLRLRETWSSYEQDPRH